MYKGWFDDTLPSWASRHPDVAVGLLRIDCDIYSSTVTIFNNLGHLLKPGTLLCFDELIGYYGWQDHEYKAFMEFVAQRDIQYEYLAYGLTYTLLRIL